MRNLRVIETTELASVPWKNGGGVTREIAQAPGPNSFAWRLSIADVESQGAFSQYPGMMRILTVIEGDGLRLRSPVKTHDVPLFTPFAFRGDLDIQSILNGGPIRDFNVISDPSQISAEVRVVNGPVHDSIVSSGTTVYAVFVIDGPIDCNGATLVRGSCALIEDGQLAVTIPVESRVLYVQLSGLPASA